MLRRSRKKIHTILSSNVKTMVFSADAADSELYKKLRENQNLMRKQLRHIGISLDDLDEYFDDIADQTDVYIDVLKDIGTDGLNTIVSTAKTGAVKVIDGTSEAVDKEKIKESDGYKGSFNTAPDAGDANDGGGSLPDEVDRSIRGEQREYGYLMYPLKRSDAPEDQDTIEFTQYTYGKRAALEGYLLPDRELKIVPNSSVTLSIPTGIRDSNRVNWTPIESNAFELAAAALSKRMMDDFAAGAMEGARQAMNEISKPETQDAVKTFIAAQASGVNNALARFDGQIINPNTELLFGGPGLRDFAYTIEMAPRDNAEAREIRKIIRFFKEGMAVRRTTGGLFLQAPNVFNIRYLYENDENHPYINLVKKQCALRDCSIDYTPQNTYMTHSEDGSMIAYRMTLQFTELEPVYYDDYVELSENSMGY